MKVDDETINSYIGYLEDAFLFEGAKRYNIKGNKYYESIAKYYSVDVGLRNARLNFRQQEITHIMENVIYNELRTRGYLVDVGVIESREKRDGKLVYIQYEVDFIANNGTDKYYIQSAYALPDEEKREQEIRSLLLQLMMEGKTILLSSHNQTDIDALCDTVLELDAGRMQRFEH